MEEGPHKAFVPVMLTPFKPNGAIDFDGLTRLTSWYLQAGAKGLFANCQSSEMYELSSEEKVQVVSHVIKVAGNRVPVVAAGNFGDTIAQQAGFMHRLYDTGVKAVIIITGLMASSTESNDLMEERILQLFDLTGDMPLGFYECPQPYKRVLTAEQLQRFVATGRVIYHKDTCLDIALVRQKLEATKSYPSFGLYDAYVVNAVDSLRAGAAGLSCIQGNYFPELIVWLCENYNTPHQAEALQKVQQFLQQHMELMHKAYPASAKYGLQKRGWPISTTVRKKDSSFTPNMQSHIDRLYTEYGRLADDLSVKVAL